MYTLAQKSSEGHLSMSREIRRVVQANPLDLDRHLHEEIYDVVDQLADPNNPLRDIYKAHYRTLDELFRSYNYNSLRSMMTVYFMSACSLEGAN